MVVADLTITERREKVVDLSVSFMYYTQEISLKKTASSKTIHLLQFLNPFDICNKLFQSVWIQRPQRPWNVAGIQFLQQFVVCLSLHAATRC